MKKIRKKNRSNSPRQDVPTSSVGIYVFLLIFFISIKLSFNLVFKGVWDWQISRNQRARRCGKNGHHCVQQRVSEDCHAIRHRVGNHSHKNWQMDRWVSVIFWLHSWQKVFQYYFKDKLKNSCLIWVSCQ